MFAATKPSAEALGYFRGPAMRAGVEPQNEFDRGARK
jgi:hypothetical protein